MVFTTSTRLYFVIEKWFHFVLATSKICDPTQKHPPAYHLLSIALVGFFQTFDLESFALIFCFDFSSALVTIETMLLKWEKCSEITNHSKPYILYMHIDICVCILVYIICRHLYFCCIYIHIYICLLYTWRCILYTYTGL